MSRVNSRMFGIAVVAGLIGLSVLAQDAPKGEKSDKSPDKTKPSTVKVEKSPIKVETSFKGVFEATDMAEVMVKPEVWQSLPVLKAVEAGTKVKEGDVLIEFDPEKIDKAIKEQETDQKMAEISMKIAELDVPLTEKSFPLDMAAAERQIKHAREDFEKWLRDKQLSIDSANFSLKSSENSLENAKEELKQLEKMYRSKDLTEETEEIILKRQRFQVEAAEHFLRLSKNRRDQTINVDLPRREREMRDNMERAELNWAKAKEAMPMSFEQKKLAFEKAKYDRSKAKEKYENLKKDRQLFTVKAPAAGVVYYGKCVQGNWTGSPMKLQKGGTVMGEEVFMTIIKPGALFVRGSVDEKDCKAINPGNPCKYSVPAFPDAKLSGTIEKIAPVPVGGNYEVKAKVDSNGVGIIPGMTCMVKVTTYENKEALTVPAGVVFTDENDDEKPYVYKVVGAGKPEKVFVKVGKKSGGKAEILSGLSEGDEVLKEKPAKDDKKNDKKDD